MSQEGPNGKLKPDSELEAHAYTDGASSGSRAPGGYGAVLRWKGKTQEISGGEQNAANQRMELTAAACVVLEKMDEGQVVTVYSDSSYLINCMRRGWYKKWRHSKTSQPGPSYDDPPIRTPASPITAMGAPLHQPLWGLP